MYRLLGFFTNTQTSETVVECAYPILRLKTLGGLQDLDLLDDSIGSFPQTPSNNQKLSSPCSPLRSEGGPSSLGMPSAPPSTPTSPPPIVLTQTLLYIYYSLRKPAPVAPPEVEPHTYLPMIRYAPSGKL